ncbi:SdrD B-like domain-containing protein, partial [Maribacter antarcticus]|uniref:SdrD B-like domain-containing protein n=1 Tax=Maribacter antarcticus TaxID=505250 RepID=UPI001B80A529
MNHSSFSSLLFGNFIETSDVSANKMIGPLLENGDYYSKSSTPKKISKINQVGAKDDYSNPPNCDVCQSHGKHDHVSGWKLRYVGPISPASIQFKTDGYSNTTYSGTHSFNDIIFIEAEDRFGTNSEFTVNGVKFDSHTSCSKPTEVGMGISTNDKFVTNPNPNDQVIMFIIEDIATAEDGWCGDTGSNPPINGCTATFVNESNKNRVLWRYLGKDKWGNKTTIASGKSVTKNVADGETWEIWNTDDDTKIKQWTIDCSGGNPEYTFGSGGGPNPPEDCDVCQSHGDHDHVSAFYLRYVGPSPASIKFETGGYSNTKYSGTHSFGDYILIQAADRFGTNSKFTVNGVSFDSHTSCSQPTEVGMGISTKDKFVTNPNPNDKDIMFIIEGISTAEDGSCGIFTPPTPASTSLGDTVFLDANQNGIQNAGENGVSGVIVNLLNCGGTQVGTTTTNSSGNYLFSDLDPNINYIVEFITPTNFIVSPANQGGNDTNDSDAGPNGRTACIDLAPNVYNSTVDAGIYNPTTPPPPEDCDVCQSHGDHDHVSAFYLRYVGPVSPANIKFETDGYSNTKYSGTHSFGDYILIQAADRFGTNSKFTVNGVSFDSHTSCSQPTEVGMGISTKDKFVTNPNPNDPDIMFIIEGISTAEDGSCGVFNPPVASLGDTVFLDEDEDGIQDPGEEGVSGVTV